MSGRDLADRLRKERFASKVRQILDQE